MECYGKLDVDHKIQKTTAQKIDESFVDTCIQCLYKFEETNMTKIYILCKGLVVVVKNETIVSVLWDKEYLKDGEDEVSKKKLVTYKWIKQTQQTWRLDLE